MIMTEMWNTQCATRSMELSRPELCSLGSSRLKDGQAIPPDQLGMYRFCICTNLYCTSTGVQVVAERKTVCGCCA
jgi:hypothetical protein